MKDNLIKRLRDPHLKGQEALRLDAADCLEAQTEEIEYCTRFRRVMLNHAKQQDTEIERLREFATYTIQHECWGINLDGGTIQDKAEKLGLLIETKYDPEIHGENDVDAVKGDPWFVVAWSVCSAEKEGE